MKNINPRQWSASYYFFFFAAMASFAPFIVLYYQSLGLRGSQIGLLVAVPPIMSLWSGPFWTGFSDARSKHRWVFNGLTTGSITIVTGIAFVNDFWLLLLLAMMNAILFAPLPSLMDNAVVSLLGDQSNQYGRLRLWGSIGWGISALLAGILVERFNIRWLFGVFAVFMLLGLLVSQRIPFTGQKSDSSFGKGVRTLLSNQRWLLFLSATFVAGMGLTSVNNYLFPYMDEIGANEGLMGFALTIGTISELPVFFFTDWLMKRFQIRGLLIIAMATIGLRGLLYWWVSDPRIVLVIQLLNGLNFPVLWVAGVAYAKESAPPGLGATAQGIFGTTLFGFAGAAGGYLGGVLLESVGGQAMFGVFGLIVLAGLPLFLIGERYMKPVPVTP
ncbi:MAG TPA: MFS transporter [Anaerolineales bacterium]|nr:MFS transporter [Anaerolineales bacterium]